MASSSMGRRSYQVFLSFRGKDIRKSFIDHLYTALDSVGIRTFKDDKELEKGKRIESELQTAILESRIAIIVFSENYASSRWCLDELVRILECKNSTGQSILPVFYKVEPSKVRYQTGSFSDAFTKLEERWTDKVDGWKAALREVADLGGMELKDEYESKFIKKIVQVIEDKLKRRPLNVPRYLIGIGYRVENINGWLQDGSSEVNILTIYGTGGLGKTTIATLVYNLNYRRFEASSFLEDVRKTLNQSDGLLRLWKTLLSDLSKQKVKIGSSNERINRIRDVISCKKVLLVFDDVEEKNIRQLETLLNMHHLFYEGSKIIITTRHKNLLKGHKAYKEHELQKFHDDESLELFSWRAFGQDNPLEEYLELSRRVVTYCGGLPLALDVLGSSLYCASVDVWKNTLEKLNEIPDNTILEVLTVSYDSLPDDNDRNVFLDIACYFIGDEKSYVVTILNECGFYTTVALENLINRCLLTVDTNNKLRMHQLTQDMGKEIIRKESPNKPGKRSRLWRHKDSFNVLKQKTGTGIIKGLMLNMDLLKEDETSLRFCNINNNNDMDLETDAFTPMQSLRLLHMSNVQLSGGYKQFPKNLRFLCWRGFPWRYVPAHFPLENLVAIDMRNSNLEQFSKGTKVLRHMKILNLSHCYCLTKTPEFSQFPSLERLILKGCVNLIEVHESVAEVKGLLLLNLKDCRSLKKLPSTIGMLEVLETLIISGCSNIEELPIDLGGMKCLKVFCADRITLGTSHSTSGSTLSTSPSITEEETSWRALIFFRSWLSKPKQVPILSWNSLPRSLVRLSLKDCSLSDEAFPGEFCNMPSLQDIDLRGNPISFLPDCIKCCTRLNYLNLSYCPELQTLIGVPRMVELYLQGCNSLEKVTFQAPDHLPTINMFSCAKLVDVEGIFKVVPLGNINEEMLSYLGLHTYDLESMKSIEILMYNWCTGIATKGSIQGVYEYGGSIFSIFLPGHSNFPGSSTYQEAGQSLFFTVPSSPPNANIRGLILRVVYARNRNSDWWVRNLMVCPYIITVISNDTKGRRLEAFSGYYALPGAGEEVIWLSHRNIKNHLLEAGDKIFVLVSERTPYKSSKPPIFEIKEIGIKLVYEDQAVKKLGSGMNYTNTSSLTIADIEQLYTNYTTTDYWAK